MVEECFPKLADLRNPPVFERLGQFFGAFGFVGMFTMFVPLSSPIGGKYNQLVMLVITVYDKLKKKM